MCLDGASDDHDIGSADANPAKERRNSVRFAAVMLKSMMPPDIEQAQAHTGTCNYYAGKVSVYQSQSWDWSPRA